MLHQKASIYLEADAIDAVGAMVRDEAVAAKIDIPCLFRPLKSSRDRMDDRAGEVLDGVFYFDRDPGVTRKHRIKLGDRDFTPVKSINANSLGRLFSVEVREID